MYGYMFLLSVCPTHTSLFCLASNVKQTICFCMQTMQAADQAVSFLQMRNHGSEPNLRTTSKASDGKHCKHSRCMLM